MTDPKKDNGKSVDNPFKIMDEIIHQLNKTKRLFIIMIISIMIIPPISFAVTFALFGPPFAFGPWHGGNSDSWHSHFFPIIPIVPILLFLVWVGIGVRQWLVLSKWTGKYELYKELQKKIDERLGDDNDEGSQ